MCFNYTEQCVYFLEDLAANLTLPVVIHHPVDDKNPVVVISWEGLNPELPSIVLNSHMDVVSEIRFNKSHKIPCLYFLSKRCQCMNRSVHIHHLVLKWMHMGTFTLVELRI